MILDEAYVVSTAWFLQQRGFEFCLHAGVCQAARPSLQRPAAGLCMRSVVPGVRGKTKLPAPEIRTASWAFKPTDVQCEITMKIWWNGVWNDYSLSQWKLPSWVLGLKKALHVSPKWLIELLSGNSHVWLPVGLLPIFFVTGFQSRQFFARMDDQIIVSAVMFMCVLSVIHCSVFIQLARLKPGIRSLIQQPEVRVRAECSDRMREKGNEEKTQTRFNDFQTRLNDFQTDLNAF